jgi:hypothetical protein
VSEGWLIGRKEILAFFEEKFGCTSWQTVRDWRRRLHCPVRSLPSGKPFVIEEEILKWIVKYDDLRKQ